MPHLNILKGNLQEIHHALQIASSPRIKLVTNLRGTRLYDASQGWGRLWKWFYFQRESCCGKGLGVDKTKKALLYTYALFQKNLSEIQQSVSQYETYLKKATHGYPVNESDVFRTRQNMTDWNDATRPFVKMALNTHQDVIEKLFNACLTQPNLPQPSIFSYPEFSILGQYQKIIDLEGITNGPLPLELFGKIAKNKKLNDSDLKELDQWIKKLNNSSCSIRHLHQTLQIIVNTIETHANDNFDKPDLIRLESMLEERGCKLFQQDDSKHIQWRNSLKKGSRLILKDKEIIIGEQIGKKILGNDCFLNFTIENMPDLVLLTGCNEAILGLKRLKHHVENGYGVEPIQIHDIFDNGRWTLVEKLRPLNTYSWTTTQSSISKQDEAFVTPLLNLMKWLIQENHTPSYFSPKYLMINSKNQLKSLKPTSKDEFNFNGLEDFAFQCATGNLKIFQYLMHHSGLYYHPYTKFYHEVITNTLKNALTQPDDLAGIYNIDDPKVVDRARKLSEDILSLKQQCCLKILTKYPYKNSKDIENLVNQNILKYHQQNKSASTVWPTLLDSIINEL